MDNKSQPPLCALFGGCKLYSLYSALTIRKCYWCGRDMPIDPIEYAEEQANRAYRDGLDGVR